MSKLAKEVKQVDEQRKAAPPKRPVRTETPTPAAAKKKEKGKKGKPSKYVPSGVPRPLTNKIAPPKDHRDNPSLECAREHMPPGKFATLNRDDIRHLRWLSFCKDEAKGTWVTKAWSEKLTPLEALRYVLRIIWTMYEGKELGSCPFDIDTIRPV